MLLEQNIKKAMEDKKNVEITELKQKLEDKEKLIEKLKEEN